MIVTSLREAAGKAISFDEVHVRQPLPVARPTFTEAISEAIGLELARPGLATLEAPAL
jgi:hypothetical protein